MDLENSRTHKGANDRAFALWDTLAPLIEADPSLGILAPRKSAAAAVRVVLELKLRELEGKA